MKLACAAKWIDTYVDRQVYEAVDSKVDFTIWIKTRRRMTTREVDTLKRLWSEIRDEEEQRNAIH